MTYEHALAIATAAHFGQVDKGGKPYIEHCIRVASQMDTEEEKVVAVLHDVFEDCDYRWRGVIENILGDELCEQLEHLNRSNGEYTRYIWRVSKHTLATKVKIADLLDNLSPERAANIPDSLRERYQKALDYLQNTHD